MAVFWAMAVFIVAGMSISAAVVTDAGPWCYNEVLLVNNYKKNKQAEISVL